MRTLLTVLLLTSSVMADLRSDAPSVVIGYLNSSGLSVNPGWQPLPPEGWIALSRHKYLPREGWITLSRHKYVLVGKSDSPNFLQVSYIGRDVRVTQASLVLNVFDPFLEKPYLDTLLGVADQLSKAATGMALSQPLRKAVVAQSPYTETVNGYKIRVVRARRPGGFSVSFSIESP